MIYYEDCRFPDARSRLFSAVKGCSKGFFEVRLGHGKSPCFSRSRVLHVIGVGGRMLFSGVVDGGLFLD